MKQAKVYIIIVTYNAMKWVDRCLGSLRESEVPCVPVIVDNLSKDETVFYIRERYPEVHLIVNNENRGFGQANNQGIEWAYTQGASHFFLLNQDAWVHPDTIGKLLEVQDRFGLAVVSPVHLNGLGDKMDSPFFSYVVTKQKNITFVSDLVTGSIKPYYEVAFVNAAAWMISRRCIEKIGGFDPIFFIYAEDSNYISRLRYHKEILAIAPSSFIHHDRGIHGDSQVYNKRAVVSRLLNTYTNINEPCFHPCWKRLKLHLWHFKNALLALLKLRFSEFNNVIQGYVLYFRAMPNVKKSREQNKKIGLNWLQTQ